MANILMLYAEQDSPLVDELRAELEKYGHNFLDAGLYPADDLNTASVVPFFISSSDISIAVFTSASVHMPRFMKESAYMVGYLSNRGELEKLIPVALDDTRVGEQFDRFDTILLEPAEIPRAATDIDARINHAMGVLAAQSETIEGKRAQVKKSAATYIESTQETLSKREKSLRLLADTWYMISYGSLGGALGLSIWKGVGVTAITSGVALTGYLLANLVSATLLVAISKLSFTLAKGYMVESLRVADRSHAFAFGEFYLNAFEEKIEWSEVKDVFQHWNIDGGSSFIS